MGRDDEDAGVTGRCEGCGCELTLLYEKRSSILVNQKRGSSRWVDPDGASLCPSDELIFHIAPREHHVARFERFPTLKGFLRSLGRNSF